LRHRGTKQSRLAALEPKFPLHEAFLFPSIEVGNEFASQESTYDIPKFLMFRGIGCSKIGF
jgi:hypothetical protein